MTARPGDGEGAGPAGRQAAGRVQTPGGLCPPLWGAGPDGGEPDQTAESRWPPGLDESRPLYCEARAVPPVSHWRAAGTAHSAPQGPERLPGRTATRPGGSGQEAWAGGALSPRRRDRGGAVWLGSQSVAGVCFVHAAPSLRRRGDRQWRVQASLLARWAWTVPCGAHAGGRGGGTCCCWQAGGSCDQGSLQGARTLGPSALGTRLAGGGAPGGAGRAS